MRFRLNVTNESIGKRSLVDIMIIKGCLYLTSSYLPTGQDDYYLASQTLVPPNQELPSSISLTQDKYYYCSKAPKLSIKPNGQCHIRANNGSTLWGLNSNRLIPITAHHGRHLFTIGVNSPSVFQEHLNTLPSHTHDITLEMPGNYLWEHFRIVGFINNPNEVTGLTFHQGQNQQEGNGTDLIPQEVGISQPIYVLRQGPNPEHSLWIGVNPGREWPQPFILELIFRKWDYFEVREGYRGGIIIMGGFNVEASAEQPMEMLTITAPIKATWRKVQLNRIKRLWAQVKNVFDQHMQQN